MAKRVLKCDKKEIFLSKIGSRSFWSYYYIYFEGKSHYYKKFFRGAEILPQSFWIVSLIESQFGSDYKKPYVKTADRVKISAKKPWNKYTFEGNIEQNFLYDGITGSNIFPFSYTTELMVLPIKPQIQNYYILRREKLSTKYPLLIKWLEKAESIWKKERGTKNKFDIYQWIDYSNKLSQQNPNKKYKIFYNETGKNLVSAVVEPKKHNNKIIFAKATIYFETDNKKEAFYLNSLLNSPIINEIIKPMQAKGLWGERGIEKKVLELPIPQYNEKNSAHQTLSKLGERISKSAKDVLDEHIKKYENVILKPQHIGRIRQSIKDHFENEIIEINKITKQIIKKATKTSSLLDFTN